MRKRILKWGLAPLAALFMCFGVMLSPVTALASEGNAATASEVTIEEEETPLVATPQERRTQDNWWWMILLAAALGITIEEYVRIKAYKGEDDEVI